MIHSTTTSTPLAAHRNDRGFVLPSILMVLVLILGLSAWSSTSSRLELRTGIASGNALEAFNIAELGLVETIRTMESEAVEAMPAWSDTTVSQTLSGGSWSVTLTALPNQLALLRATGTVSNGSSNAGATRELGQVVRVRPSRPLLAPLAALTTRGYVKVGGASKVSGVDPGAIRSTCSATNPDAAGIHIDDASNVNTKGKSGVEGSPKILQDGSLANAETFESIGGASWDEWVASATLVIPGGTVSQILPSYVGSICDESNPNNWGEPDAVDPSSDPCGNYWPVVYSETSLHVTGGGRGQGVLIVDGDVEFSGGLDFQGVVIARGLYKATGNGNNVTGSVYAANIEISDQKAAGRSDTIFSQCVVDMLNSQINMVGGLVPLDRRSWADVSSVVGS